MNNKNNRYMTAEGTLLESDAGVTRTLNATSDDLKRQIEAAAIWRDHLLIHLLHSTQPGGTPLGRIEGPLPDDAEADRDPRTLLDMTQNLIAILPSTEIVLWRPDLMQIAESQAGNYANVPVVEADLPQNHEFWCCYGPEIAPRAIGGTHKLFLQVLLSGVTIGKPFATLVAFYFPYEGEVVLLDRPPLVRLIPPLTIGHPAQGVEAQRLLACLTFRAQAFIEEAAADIHYTPSERRQIEREGRMPPAARIINLRPKKWNVNEDADGQSSTRREL
ncbi:MAG: hypothetical protein ACRYFS_13515 [Janthinobacterium lividum]